MPREGSGVIIVITPLPLASRERSRQEDSHSGRVRTLGKRVKGNLSRVQIPHPPLVSLASADSLISESLIPEEPLPYLHITSWDILRQKMALNKSLTKVSDLAKYKEVGLSTTLTVVTGCIPIRKWQI